MGSRNLPATDPFIQQGPTLVGPENFSNGGTNFGEAMAVSADGDTALIGGFFAGAARVFVRSGSIWRQQAKLTLGSPGSFGSTVALSADGNTALIGQPSGVAWVYIRSGSKWMQSAELTPSDAVATGAWPVGFGGSVALSADGDTALIGGGGDEGGVGAAWVFMRVGRNWVQQGPKLVAGDESSSLPAEPGFFGTAVALSANGDTALIGGPGDGGDVGAAWVFTRSRSAWTQEGPKITGTPSRRFAFGTDLALSADGSTALIDGGGGFYVYVHTAGSWSQQGPRLNAHDARGQVLSLSLSADGDTALAGGAGSGAAWIFTRSGSAWTEDAAKLTGIGETQNGFFGLRVALAADGDTALIAGPYEPNGRSIGWVWVFTRAARCRSTSQGRVQCAAGPRRPTTSRP